MFARRGFTLVELLVVIAAMAILVAIALPTFRPTPNVEAKAAAHSVAAGLRRTRSLAVTEHRAADLGVDLDTRRVAVEGARRPVRLPRGLTYELTAAQSLTEGRTGAIRFFPDGSSTGGRLSVTAPGTTYHVDVDWFTGRVRILTEDNDGA